MTPQILANMLEGFLSQSSSAVVIEDGAVVFDLESAKYSISGESNKCLLHLWSSERNVVRRVLDVESKGETLRITVQRIGQARPTKLEICRDRDRRSPSVKRAARAAYQRVLERVLRKRFPDFTVAQLSTSMDLEKSFGPIYARGLVRRGQSAFAVLGANSQELQSSIDASLTFGILWLDVCRQANAGKLVIEGLKLFVPQGRSELIRERISQLNPEIAKWQLFELNERTDELIPVEIPDRGNVATRLVRCTDESAVRTRFAEPIALVQTVMPEVEIGISSPAEIAFRCHGQEFARARLSAKPGDFNSAPEIVFGLGAGERVLDGSDFAQFERLVHSIGEARHAEGPSDNPYWRLHPERWLESLVVKNVAALDDQLDSRWNYSQVPAFSAADRAMIDVLTVTHSGRLAVVELKADEDIHLPLQGIDYWSRVEWHHARGEFQKFGYFAGRELSPQKPLLIMVAPALRVHPTTDTLLKYVSPHIDWTLLGINELWRKEVKVVFRKRPQTAQLRKAV
ncbi:MAG TPA: hypothetical protein VJ731_12630 [Terriglobales bacterium]|nr:hypothetical protein [Terriglobales bacterium]